MYNIMVVLVMSVTTGALRAQPHIESYKLKAAIFHRFRNFVSWTDNPGRENVVCIIGKDPFRGVLQKLEVAERERGGVINLFFTDGIEPQCGLLFIPKTELSRLKQHLKQAQKYSIVTVSDIPNFVSKGGIIEMEQESDRIQFSINLTMAKTCKINVSSRLLQLARTVIH